MPTMIALLRGINVGGNNILPMERLRAICASLGLQDAQTLLQSGNVVFRTALRDPAALAARMEDAIEQAFGFRPAVILRTAPELQDAMARNPFSAREGIEPNRLLVLFLAGHPAAEARQKALAIKADPEELHINGRELFIYFPNGMGRPKLSVAQVERTLKVPGTGRNWNTVMKLMQIAQSL